MPDKKILVVDDDSDTVVYLSTFLQDHGYEVRSAQSTALAMEQLEQFAARAILIDVMMPGESGLGLLVKLRSDPRWCDIQIIVVSGDDKIVEERGRSYLALHDEVRGPDHVLGKPVDPEQLLSLLAGS